MHTDTFTDAYLHMAQLAAWLPWGIATTVLVSAAVAFVLWSRAVATPRPRRAERLETVLPVTSTSEAFAFAHSLLAVTTCDVPRLVGVPGSVDHDRLWREVAHRPLTALVYTASWQPRPLAWLEHTVSGLGVGDQDGGWRAAVEAVAAVDSTLCEWVKNTAAMEPRQRGSVAVVMRDALTQYAAAQR
ncbi:hypothetical protein CKJ56_13400 [Mycobacterium intracellulare subsp. chimaera]|jgi:hypothetical protein|nr:hypothetical protein CKJ58_26430 [Mycobacterium intracellulare subsp. chimaera]PBA61342.1 hypothetical protein CKJ56_13400 [Mycobacterium intracellulare subsp. chimaera]